jgi:lipopolysaccharide transport system permease protein
MLQMLLNLWHYRYFVFGSIKNELRIRFARSKFGVAWMIIHPLAQVLVYTLIFSNIMKAKMPGIENKYSYAIYLMSGVLAWSLFSDIINRCLNLFIENANIIKKVNFPRITLPGIAIGSCLINNICLFFIIFTILLLISHTVSSVIFCLIPLTLIVVAFSFGIGLILGILNVFLRDIAQILPIALQVLFWFTPIVYPKDIIPAKYHSLAHLNPLYHIIEAYHQILVYNILPEISGLALSAVISFLLLVSGMFLFRRASPEMPDVL